MTARSSKPKARPQRRIIERPRLTKLLDATDARTILLIAPAGYGKTTLARQWAKTLNGAIWVTLTPAHRDVAWIAEDLAEALESTGSKVVSEIRAHIRARQNVQSAGLELGRTLAHLAQRQVKWIVLDDYHEITSSPEAESLVGSLEQHFRGRLLVTSRGRPAWMSARRLLYGDVHEITRDDLAMDQDEVERVLGRGGPAARLSAQADGWPAVIGLAASLDVQIVPNQTLPSAIHRYLAEELYSRSPADFQDELLTLALLGTQRQEALEERYGRRATKIARVGQDLGFNTSDDGFELHPLLREFLLQKVAREENAEARVREAIETHVATGAWDRALELVLRFDLEDLVEPTVELAFKPLTRSGRLETLATFVRAIDKNDASPPPTVSVALAELALHDGNLGLAQDLAARAGSALPQTHSLASRAATIVGRTAFLLADFATAGQSFAQAQELAQDSDDEREAIHGLASSSVFGEQPEAAEALVGLSRLAGRSATDYLRHASISLDYRRIGGDPTGLAGPLPLEGGRRAHENSEDPRARTAFAYAVAGALNFRADYNDARPWLDLLFADADRFDLEFILPFANWTLGQTALGQRKFGEAERALQAIEDAATRSQDRRHEINARALRGRLLLQTGQPDGAVACLSGDIDVPLIPSWRAEYLATRAVALACIGARRDALAQAEGAARLTAALDVQLLVGVARALATGVRQRDCRELLQQAQITGVWDPIVCGLRASAELAQAVIRDPHMRPLIEALVQRTGDVGLAKRAGFRIRTTRRPDEILSPRELEVLELIGRGYRNRDISSALFIADSTTKVHVRHILEKLGVRTRSEAVARYQMFRGRAD